MEGEGRIEEGRNPLPLLPSFLSFPTRNSFTSHGQNILRKPDATHPRTKATNGSRWCARVRVYTPQALTCKSRVPHTRPFSTAARTVRWEKKTLELNDRARARAQIWIRRNGTKDRGIIFLSSFFSFFFFFFFLMGAKDRRSSSKEFLLFFVRKNWRWKIKKFVNFYLYIYVFVRKIKKFKNRRGMKGE